MDTRRYHRTTHEAFPHGAEYGCAIERPNNAARRRRIIFGLYVIALLLLWTWAAQNAYALP